MKKLFLLIALFGVLAVGCEELFPTEQTPNAIPIFETDSESSYIVSADGEEITIMVTTNIDYSVVIPKDAEDWLSVVCTRSDTHEEILSFVVAPNGDFEERTTKAELVDGNGEVIETISFIQEGQSKIFDIDSEDFYIFEPEGSSVTIDVTTNLEYSVVIDKNVQSWLSVADTRATLREETLTFTAAPNDTDKIRYAFVELIDADNNVLQEIPFIQSAITQSDSSCPNDEIWYTNGSTTEATTPYATDVFGANIESNAYDAEKECWVIKFDGEVTSIGKDAFGWCSSLTSVTIPDSVTTIGDSAFASCSSLTSVTIPDSVTTIENNAFNSCSSLISATIPDSVTTIGWSAFAWCSSLTSVTIPDSVTAIGNCAFVCCSNLQEFKGKFASDSERCLIVDGTLNSFAPAGLSEYTIPNSVTTIGYLAFGYCSSLTSVTIPDSVTTIEDYAFYWCESLTSVYCKATTPPAGGSYMFSNNASDRKIYVPTESVEAYMRAEWWSEYADDIVGYNFETGEVTPSNTIPSNEIWYTNGSTTEATTPYATDVFGANIVSNTYDAAKECWVIKFDGKVTTIGDYAFYDCDSLTSVTIPDSVTTIGDYAFYYCESLTSVTIPDSVTTIGYGAFYYCSSLTSITIPDSVTTIGGYAFAYCDSLTSVTIPDSVTTIRHSAFRYCSSLTSVTIPDSVTTIGGYVFSSCGSLQELNGKFTSEDGRCWIIDGTLNAFAPAGLTEYSIPDSVTSIGSGVFEYCSNLTSVTIPDSVTTIGYSAFWNCESLTSVTIPDSVMSIEWHAFAFCSNLEEFQNKFASEDGRCLIIDGTLNAFAPAGLTEYTIPDSVTTIGEYAFSGCSRLTSITIPDSVTTIGDWVFAYCDSLTSITIPDNVTTIGWYAFYDCSSLTSVTIPDSVTTIRDYAFHYCSSLTSVYCKATTPPVGGSDMFYGNATGRKIYVPMESVEAYKSASYWSSYASDIVGYNF